uniref:non-specific serine/threonine protein kinase n=1 Tax=Salmo trutta TaxID=8032 RepID=A0A673X9Z4_SALTR
KIDNSLVVWKEVDLNCLSDKEHKDVTNEISILFILQHNNINSLLQPFHGQGHSQYKMTTIFSISGGNLFDKINQQKGKRFTEEVVIWYLYQVTSAVAHIHKAGILHRDIKTLNIFLTKTNLIELGDNILSISLESCAFLVCVATYPTCTSHSSGDNFKSDIWAMKPPNLCVKMVQGNWTMEVNSEVYSSSLIKLVYECLDQDKNGPTADEILDQLSNTIESPVAVVTTRSREVYFWGGEFHTPETGSAHLGLSKMLGHGAQASYRQPRKVERLQGKAIRQVACGADFTACVTGEWSACVTGEWSACVLEPVLLEFFEEWPVRQVSCADNHVVAFQRIPYTTTLTLVKQLARYKIQVISAGKTHTAAINGTATRLSSFFSDPQLKLGVKDFKKDQGIQLFKVSCGDGFTIAATEDNQIFAWGKAGNRCSLHHVPDLSCRGWHTILTMEMSTLPAAPWSPSYDPHYTAMTSLTNQTGDSSCPVWLRQFCTQNNKRNKSLNREGYGH